MRSPTSAMISLLARQAAQLLIKASDDESTVIQIAGDPVGDARQSMQDPNAAAKQQNDPRVVERDPAAAAQRLGEQRNDMVQERLKAQQPAYAEQQSKLQRAGVPADQQAHRMGSFDIQQQLNARTDTARALSGRVAQQQAAQQQLGESAGMTPAESQQNALRTKDKMQGNEGLMPSAPAQSSASSPRLGASMGASPQPPAGGDAWSQAFPNQQAGGMPSGPIQTDAMGFGINTPGFGGQQQQPNTMGLQGEDLDTAQQGSGFGQQMGHQVAQSMSGGQPQQSGFQYDPNGPGHSLGAGAAQEYQRHRFDMNQQRQQLQQAGRSQGTFMHGQLQPENGSSGQEGPQGQQGQQGQQELPNEWAGNNQAAPSNFSTPGARYMPQGSTNAGPDGGAMANLVGRMRQQMDYNAQQQQQQSHASLNGNFQGPQPSSYSMPQPPGMSRRQSRMPPPRMGGMPGMSGGMQQRPQRAPTSFGLATPMNTGMSKMNFQQRLAVLLVKQGDMSPTAPPMAPGADMSQFGKATTTLATPGQTAMKQTPAPVPNAPPSPLPSNGPPAFRQHMTASLQNMPQQQMGFGEAVKGLDPSIPREFQQRFAANRMRDPTNPAFSAESANAYWKQNYQPQQQQKQQQMDQLKQQQTAKQLPMMENGQYNLSHVSNSADYVAHGPQSYGDRGYNSPAESMQAQGGGGMQNFAANNPTLKSFYAGMQGSSAPTLYGPKPSAGGAPAAGGPSAFNRRPAAPMASRGGMGGSPMT